MGRWKGISTMTNSAYQHELHKPVTPGGRNAVGIDIGRTRHAAAGVRSTGQTIGKTMFGNDRSGIDRVEELLLKPLGGPRGVLVAMEATGHYWKPVCYELKRRGYLTRDPRVKERKKAGLKKARKRPQFSKR